MTSTGPRQPLFANKIKFDATRLISLAFTLVFTLFLAACFSSPPIEEHFYLLQGPPLSARVGQGPRILVADFTTAAGYDTARMAYRVSPHELRYYAYRQWASEPPRLLAEMTVRHFRASGRFGDVARGDKIREPDAIVEAQVEAMEQVDLADTWQARLAMTYQVRKGDLDKILLRHAFDISLPCARQHPDEVARGIGRILTSELEKLMHRMVSTIR